jgi:hypothetical protein
MWTVEFYETATGQCPVREFLNNLNIEKELPRFMHDIGLLEEYGPQLKRPYADTLRDNIHELRTRVGRINFRILYFFFYNEKIILTHGCSKIDIVPSSEIDKAIRYKDDYFSRNARMR